MKVSLSALLACLFVSAIAAQSEAATYGTVTLTVPVSVNFLPSGAHVAITCDVNPPAGSGMTSGGLVKTITLPVFPPGSTSYGTTLSFVFNPTAYGKPAFPSGTTFSCSIGGPGAPPDAVDPSQSTMTVGPVTLK
jgi:hypothetical protein